MNAETTPELELVLERLDALELAMKEALDALELAMKERPQPLSVGIRQAAEMTSIGQGEIRRLVRTGELKHLKIGIKIVIPVYELEAYLAREAKAA